MPLVVGLQKSEWFSEHEPGKLFSGLEGRGAFKFEEMQKSLEVLSNPYALNLHLYAGLKDYLSEIFDLPVIIADTFDSTIDVIRKKRNDAGHTSAELLTQPEASDIIDKTETFLKTWINAKK